MTKNIGICGAHRTGKTTLAKELAQALGIPYIAINTSDVFSFCNLDPALPMDFKTRLFIQTRILKHACEVWDRETQSFICDRTSIDMMAYTLADVQGNTLTQEMEYELDDYLKDCKNAVKKYFNVAFVIPPAIPIVAARGKASLSRGYIEHIHTIVAGICFESQLPWHLIDRECVNLVDRVDECKTYLNY